MMRSLRTALAAALLAITAAAAAQESAPATADCTFDQGMTRCVTDVYPTEPQDLPIDSGFTFCGTNGTLYQLLQGPATMHLTVGNHFYRETTVYRGQSNVVASEESLLMFTFNFSSISDNIAVIGTCG
ncbi:MAG: hypothetical protein ACNA8N_12890 [Trueperaceae bacterium]